MYCQNCGKKLHDSAVICPQCGVAVGRGVHVSAPGKINGMGLAGFVLSLAAVLVLALFHSAFCAVIVLPAFALSLCGTMQCRAEPREYGGKAFAVVGLVVSAILLAVYLFLFLSVSAVAVLFLPLFAVI